MIGDLQILASMLHNRLFTVTLNNNWGQSRRQRNKTTPR